MQLRTRTAHQAKVKITHSAIGLEPWSLLQNYPALAKTSVITSMTGSFFEMLIRFRPSCRHVAVLSQFKAW